MRIKLFLNKSAKQNSSFYFEKAKKLKAKLEGIEKTYNTTIEKIENLEKEQALKKEDQKIKEVLDSKKKWYEDKFRHTYTDNGFLFVIGKDASSNENLIKKYLEKNDLVFHTSAPKSPFGILKDGLNTSKEIDLFEASQFLACFSNFFKEGFGVCDVFYVKFNQVSKTAKSGEFMGTGSFMINGKKNFIKNVEMKISLGFYFEKIDDEDKIKVKKIISGSPSFIKKKCIRYLTFSNGSDKTKMINKKVKKKLGFEVSNLSHFLPSNIRVLK